MFECMEIAEIIYKGVVTPSYKKNTREKANSTGLSRNEIREAALSNTHPRRMKALASAVNNM